MSALWEGGDQGKKRVNLDKTGERQEERTWNRW